MKKYDLVEAGMAGVSQFRKKDIAMEAHLRDFAELFMRSV